MEQIGVYIATITSGTPEERLRALAPLGLAIALFLASIESSNDVSLLLTVLEQTITTIANTGRALALGQLREIAGALENFHCRACRTYAIYEGSLWQSALACTLTAYNVYCTSNWAHPDMPLGMCVHIVDAFVEGLQTVLIGATVSATSLVYLPSRRGEPLMETFSSGRLRSIASLCTKAQGKLVAALHPFGGCWYCQTGSLMPLSKANWTSLDFLSIN